MLTFYFKNTTLKIPNGIFLPSVSILTHSKTELEFFENLYFLKDRFPRIAEYYNAFELIRYVKMEQVSFTYHIS